MTWVAIGKAAGTWLLTETRRKGEEKAASAATAVMNPIVSIASDMVILMIGIPMIGIPVGGIWFFENVGTLRQFTSPAGIAKMMLSGMFEGEGESGDRATSSSTGDAVAAAALKWVDRDFNPGVQAQCAVFIRAVLEEAGVEMGSASVSWDGYPDSGPALASSFFSDELGQRIDPANVQPGDLVAFTNTYGSWARGTITHVAVVVIRNGVLGVVDRPTSSAPVKFRAINSLPWPIAYAIRPSGYKTTQGGTDRNSLVSEAANFVGGMEGFTADAYWDYAQYSIGYGTKANSPNEVIDEAEARRRLRDRVAIDVDAIGRVVTADLTPNQIVALASLRYNLGGGAIDQSPLIQKLNRGDIQGAAAEFDRYVHAGGAVLPGLVKRRATEKALFLR